MRLGAAQLVEPAEHPEVLAARQVLVDGRVLAGQADQLAELLGVRRTSKPATRRRARVGLQQRREDAHGRRLAGAVRPEQAEDRAFLDLEVDPVEGPHLADLRLRRS